jgi:hemerythrin-like domain-containing protein
MIAFIILFLGMITHESCLYAHKKESVYTQKDNNDIPFTEDLMREHGVLNRILLIYEEVIKRIDTHPIFPFKALTDALDILKSFIEDYHEKFEENYVFPIFKKQKKELHLIKTLKKQHDKGRKITNKIQTILSEPSLDNKAKKHIKKLLKKFIKMYRPHEAREDTILFPQIRSLINEDEFKALSEKSEESEEEIFGKNGFEKIVKRIELIEKDLGIYELSEFTP